MIFHLSLEWQLISSGLQDSSQYSGRSQQCYSLACLDLPLISIFFSPLFKPFGIVSRTTNTILIIVTFMFHSFFCSLARSKYFFMFSLSFILTPWSIVGKFSFLCSNFVLLTGIRWLISISKSQRVLWILFSRMDSNLCMYHLIVW